MVNQEAAPPTRDRRYKRPKQVKSMPGEDARRHAFFLHRLVRAHVMLEEVEAQTYVRFRSLIIDEELTQEITAHVL